MRTLLITVDALRKDHLECYGYDRNTTPFLDRLAEENSFFKNCYSASCHTREAIPSILTGRKPENCIKGYYRLNAPTLPEKLPEKVETTGITTGCYLTRTENHDRGFDSFRTDYTIGDNFTTRQLEYLARIALNKQHKPIEKQKEKIKTGLKNNESFVWSHFMDTHAPYNKYDKNYFGEDISKRKLQYLFRKAAHKPSLMSKKDREKLIDAYDNSLRHLDSKLEEIISEIPEDTDVIVVGDHGELLGERDKYEHPRELIDELLEVPLIIKNGEDREVERKVSTIDIAPTIAKKYGLEAKWNGQNLYSEREGNIKASCLRKFRRKIQTV